jgi:hypothetical protein
MNVLKRLALCGALPSIFGTQAPTSDYISRLATLLVEDGRPSVESLDNLVRELYTSQSYKQLLKTVDVDGTEFYELIDSVGHPSTAKAADEVPANAGVASNFAPRMRTGKTGRSGIVYSGLGESATIFGIPEVNVAETDPSDANHKSMQYIITTIDTLSHLLLVINQLDVDIKTQTYVEILKTLDTDFNTLLAQLANEAIDRLSLSTDSADVWKEAVWRMHLLVVNYVSQEKSIDDWNPFKEQVTVGLKKLVDYAVVAKSAVNTYEPTSGESNDKLKQELQNAAVDTTCLCIWKCAYTLCTRGAATNQITTTGLPGAEFTVAIPSTTQAIQTLLFIESSVATLLSLIREIETLDASGADGKERILNLELRIGIRIVNIIKQALVNDALTTIYDKLRGRSVLILGTMSGIVESTSWDAVKNTVSTLISAIVSDLNASKPSNII